MAGTLVDSSVLLDVATQDPIWFDWSAAALADAVRSGPVLVNPIVYAGRTSSSARMPPSASSAC